MSKKTAVVLFQLGGPDSLEAVKPFLYNLFCDPDIIDFPGAFLGRKLLARTISSLRSKKVEEHYQEIGGRSPILELTRQQAEALERQLRSAGLDANVFIAMRYWHPLTDVVARDIQKGEYEQILLLPLYPHYSKATTLSSVNEWNRQARRYALQNIPTQLICCYPNHPSFIDALVENIQQAYGKFSGIDPSAIDLVFSAHGVPVDFIKKGDPYQLQIEETVRRVMLRGGWTSPHLLCYQSKVGPQQWLQPSLTSTIAQLAQQGRKHLLVIPVAFVTDHIETLHEINIEEREQALHLGVEHFEMMPALNAHPKFIACLTDLVVARARSNGNPVSKCKKLWQEHSQRPEPTLCPWYHLR